MKKLSWSMASVLVLLVVTVCGIIGCGENADSSTKQMGEWEKLGYVFDGGYGTTIWKRKDPETGAPIYVVTGHGSIFVGNPTR